MGPHPAVAAVRLAVRQALRSQPTDRPALVACSGGADSLALAEATLFDCRRTGRAAGLVTVDHQLQPGSAEQAARVSALGYELGFDPVVTLPVDVAGAGGPEAAARAARYGAVEKVRGDGLVLLGHTADDQAETVLLGLGRGSGARSLAGMRPASGGYLRPLLGLRRSHTLAACAALGLPVWHDPHNADPRYRRVRLRTEVLPLLEDVLAGGVSDALARTAAQLQDDLDALDELAARLTRRAATPAACGRPASIEVAALAAQPDAIATRALKRWAESEGCAALSAVHVGELLRLVRDWHGQSPLHLPGGVHIARRSGRLAIGRAADQRCGE